MTGPGPFDNDTGAGYLAELSRGVPLAEVEAVLAAHAPGDLELAREQYALATVVAEMTSPGHAPHTAAAVAAQLRHDDTAGVLSAAARDSMNRLLANPYAAIWQNHPDGGIAIRRKVRALRARLHRACSG